MLDPVGDVAFGVHQEFPGQPDDLFIRATTCRRWQLVLGGICDVDADDREITVFQFPDVRTIATANRLGTVGMRIRTDAFDKFHTPIYLTIAK